MSVYRVETCQGCGFSTTNCQCAIVDTSGADVQRIEPADVAAALGAAPPVTPASEPPCGNYAEHFPPGCQKPKGHAGVCGGESRPATPQPSDAASLREAFLAGMDEPRNEMGEGGGLVPRDRKAAADRWLAQRDGAPR